MKKFIIILLFQITILYAQSNHLIPFKKNGKIGFVDNKISVVIEPQYDAMDKYKDDTFVMFLKDKKCYVLVNKDVTKNISNYLLLGNDCYSIYQKPDTYIYNSKGKQIRALPKLQHDHKSTLEYMIVFNGSNEDIIMESGDFLFNDEKILEVFDYDKKTQTALVRYVSKGFCLITTNGIKNKDRFIFGIRSLEDSMVFGKNTKTGESGFYDMDCNLIIKAEIKSGSDMDNWNCYPSISCGVVSFASDGEKLILLSEGQTLHSDNWSIVDKSGEVLANKILADYIYPFSDDVAVVKLLSGEKWIYKLIDKKGEIITDINYDEIFSSVNGYCMAKKDGIDYLIRSKDGMVYKCNDFNK